VHVHITRSIFLKLLMTQKGLSRTFPQCILNNATSTLKFHISEMIYAKDTTKYNSEMFRRATKVCNKKYWFSFKNLKLILSEVFKLIITSNESQYHLLPPLYYFVLSLHCPVSSQKLLSVFLSSVFIQIFSRES